MTGSLAGGGVGAFWSLFINSNLPQALASALIGVFISYMTHVLMPMHEGNKRRLGKAGKALDDGIDWVTDRTISAARGFERKYLLCQASVCQRLRSEGVAQYDRVMIPFLKDAYVPLALDFSATEVGFKAEREAKLLAERECQDLDIWQILAKSKTNPNFRQMAILAWGGYGKTTLLKHIAYRYGIKQHPKDAPDLVPVLLVLRDYRELFKEKDIKKLPDLPTLITERHIPRLPKADELKPRTDWAKDMLKQGRAIVMFDGFDEMATDQRPVVSAWLNEQIRNYDQSVFILTSRPKAYKNLDVAHQLNIPTTIWVRDFDEAQRRDFVEKWYRCQERYTNIEPNTPDVEQVAIESANDLLQQIESRQELKALAKNPLLLNMITTFHRRNPGARLPQRRVELYQDICTLQLRDRPRARTLDTLLTQCDAQTVLEHIAITMMICHEERIEKSRLIAEISRILWSQGERRTQAEDFVEQVVEISELLVQQEDEYEFAHLSFQEYLAAASFLEMTEEEVLYSSLKDDWWKATILLYVGLTKQPQNLIQAALDREASDVAYACLRETTRYVDAELEQRVIINWCSQLENYLKSGEWEKADDETYRLMITAIGKEEGQGFTPDEVLNFPCDELLTIDGLWVKYSNGRFGFSVQKDIYLSKEVGGIADGKYHPEAFNRFVDQVGWRSIYYDIVSPTGHLPTGSPSLMGDWSSLFSHRDL